jgi:hypothetical protein
MNTIERKPSQFRRWQEAKEEETEAVSKVSLAEEELKSFGVDPNGPPDWLDD